MTERAVGAPRLSAGVNEFAVGQEALLRHFVRAGDDQLHDEHEQENRRRLEEEAEIDTSSVSRPQPRDARRADHAGRRAQHQIHRVAQLHEQQHRLEALAADHQQREQEHAHERSAARTPGRRLEAHLDVALHLPARAPHVHGQPGHRSGRDHRQRTLEPFLVRRVEQQIGADDAGADGHGNAPMHGGDQRGATRLAEK